MDQRWACGKSQTNKSLVRATGRKLTFGTRVLIYKFWTSCIFPYSDLSLPVSVRGTVLVFIVVLLYINFLWQLILAVTLFPLTSSPLPIFITGMGWINVTKLFWKCVIWWEQTVDISEDVRGWFFESNLLLGERRSFWRVEGEVWHNLYPSMFSACSSKEQWDPTSMLTLAPLGSQYILFFGGSCVNFFSFGQGRAQRWAACELYPYV